MRVEIVFKQLLLIAGLSLLSGCAWAVRQETDQTIHEFVEHPFDVNPELTPEAVKSTSATHARDRAFSLARSGDKTPVAPEVLTDVLTTAWMESGKKPARRDLPLKDDQVQTIALVQPQPKPRSPAVTQPGLSADVAPGLPGSEAPRIVMPREPGGLEREIERIYPELPPLPVEPKVLRGPKGRPYTLADFQRMAAQNSPTLRQAASDVEAAKGNLIQAKTYPNPTLSYLVDPSNNNSTAGVQGGAIDQPIITGGKMRLGVAAAQKNLDNAILALKRSRSDLSTAVRNAYFGVLVDVETLVLTRSLAQFSDDVYRLQTGLLKGTQAAPYEPTALRAQSATIRLAYRQAIQSYIYDWKALTATLGLPQLPLSEIAGRVDRFIPYYDYDEVREQVMRNHTDILTARNVVKIAQYNLKVAQVTPIFPNLDLRYALEKDFALGPFGTYQTLGLGFPLPVWDQNKGNIIAGQAALLRASEESHRVEVALTAGLATAYEGYRNNLYAMEYYRRYILPDLVRYYRGVFERRQIDPGSAFGDLVFAQQNLSTNVTAYIGILGSLWTSVVAVADYLQTDDLFQTAKPRALPELPDLHDLRLPSNWTCGHDGRTAASATGVETSDPHRSNPAAGSPARSAAGVQGSETDVTPFPVRLGPSPIPPPQTGAGDASPPRSPVVPPPEPRPAKLEQAPASSGGLEGDPTAGLNRTRGAVDDPAAPLKSYFGKGANPGGRALLGMAPSATSYFGEEGNHEGQNL